MNTFAKTSMAVGVSLALAPMAAGTTVTEDISGTNTWDLPGSPFNETLTLDLAAALGLAPGSSVTVTGIGWDVVISTVGPSWLSEVGVGLEGFTLDGLNGPYGFGLGTGDAPGTGVAFSTGGILDFGDDFTLPDLVLSDGILNIEFIESYDDVTGAIDAMIDSGTLSFEANATVVPIPAAFPLLASGLLGLFAAGRRRRAA